MPRMTDASRKEISVTYSDWVPASISLPDETIFAIGDVHGCAAELEVLLNDIAQQPTNAAHTRRLVFLGDMIDRGASSAGVLRLWARDAAAWNVDRIDRVMGNHEQLLLLAMTDTPHKEKATNMWLSEAIGGGTFFREMMELSCVNGRQPDFEFFSRALGDEILHLFITQISYVAIGNLILVHAGLDPARDRDEFLSQPWTSFTDAQWAWIHGDFLKWQGGFDGRIIVHGHTPPHMHRELAQQEDPHLLIHDRLGLDGGTTRTGVVTAAQIRHGQYRILRASVRHQSQRPTTSG